MLKATKTIEILESLFSEQQDIVKYKIYLNLDASLSFDLVVKSEHIDSIREKLKTHIDNSDTYIYIEDMVTEEEYSSDEWIRNKFANTDEKGYVDYSSRKRLTNLIENRRIEDDDTIHLPVVSFYSYKGGVGRSTALSVFANHCSYHQGKSVVILDFDFEAPGLVNFFDITDDLTSKNGIVEYLLDTASSKEPVELSEYIHEVSNTYSGNGSIFVMPAGNLSNEKNIRDYLEALARLNINGTELIVNQIRDLMRRLQEDISINPDVILIDSRTGFNDIFGLLIHNLSTAVVGLFEENIQTKPGLTLFLQEFYKPDDRNINTNVLLVNSLVHKKDRYQRRYNCFTKEVDEIINSFEGDPNYLCVPLKEHLTLSNIGTLEYDKDDYLEFISANSVLDYRDFFSSLLDLISFPSQEQREVSELNDQLPSQDISLIDQRKTLLQKIQDNFPEPYAENDEYTSDFLEKKFFFRKCMEDVFHTNKFLLIGGKGTGKTSFYKALQEVNFVTSLQKKANKTQIKYIVIDIVSLRNVDGQKAFISLEETFKFADIQDKEYFFTRFWKVFIANSIMLKRDTIGYPSDLAEIAQTFSSNSSTRNRDFFINFIKDDEKFGQIEEELDKIEQYLKKQDINLLIIFDQLDYLSKPINWSNTISPLINFFATRPFLKIQPKIFLRRDLYLKLSNITNKQSLEVSSIHL